METESLTSVHGDIAEGTLLSVDQELPIADGVIIQFLMQRVPEFRKLQELRKQGWNNPQGDQYFRQQRDRADKANARTARFFYNMMQRIGQEVHSAVGAFAIQDSNLSRPMVLDMCAAPGGFLHTALELNPKAQAVAFSLPVESGGHKILIPNSKRFQLKFLDITMLAADMGLVDVPVEHPDHSSFLPQQLKPGDLFDLVICDGQVLRTHARKQYRENREAYRLTVTQLCLGLEHARPGSTMIVLLHKLEAWDTVLLLNTFREFATVGLFKPKTSHAKRSSFYMIARNIQSQGPAAAHAIAKWKSIWKAATCETNEEFVKVLRGGEPSVKEVLDEFGLELIVLGKDVWATQVRALEKAPFIKQRS
ncbi:uncharacterized protein CTRU02_215435 [Colletotrichum truncatum]|uniref:Uncharacterized protein n=1 Tax=Colletotrichum truncatum TaxID=5467 RepID=A0ACC3YCM5_COLTU|nr:uncharacterized protein CTRU02_05624 [Colletotrichum truncatum]KAF6794067.1 hypothetical protein CTRU02_05624 [Colletotrichum truncatum]